MSILERGFTLIELLVVISIVGLLTSIVLFALNPVQQMENSRAATAKAALEEIGKAAHAYVVDSGAYPPDANRNVPTQFMSYIGAGTWPGGPFPGSVYDWDNWEGETCWDGSAGGIQVSLRDINSYQGNSDYSLYYVVQGNGIPHCHDATVRGECVNCVSRYP